MAWAKQATPRVDVDGDPQASAQQAAASYDRFLSPVILSSSPGLGACERYPREKENYVFGCSDICEGLIRGLLQVFVADVDGRTLVYRVPGDLTVDGLRDALLSQVPGDDL